MSGADLDDIWIAALDEGERRLNRSIPGLCATGLLGGLDVMVGILLLCLITGAVAAVAPIELAHVVGSLSFGIAFVFITIGRSELFTENFLLPVGATLRERGSRTKLARLWGVTLVTNLLGLALLAALLVVPEVLKAATLEEGGRLADEYAERGWPGALASAVVAGAVMTLFTWLAAAAQSDSARIATALLLGFALAAPTLNHAVVSFGEMLFGILAGTAASATLVDVTQNLGVAIAGNLLGGLGLVTITRLVQVAGEDRGDETPES